MSHFGLWVESQGSSAGAVQVILTGTGTVSAAGNGASGIFADSSGGGSNGNISISIGRNSMVSGGSGNAAGIRLIDGATNTITNAGTITTVAGANGVAIRADGSGRTTLVDTGSVIGSTYGVVSFLNEASGLFAPGAQVNLGAGGVLRNLGALDVGGDSRTGTTELTGNLVQESSGKLAFDVDGVDDYSRLLVSDDADLVGGTIDIDFMKNVLSETQWEAFDLISAAALQFSDLNFVFTGVERDFRYFERVENNTLVLEARAVPEPRTLSLLGVGFLGLVLFRLRRPPAL